MAFFCSLHFQNVLLLDAQKEDNLRLVLGLFPSDRRPPQRSLVESVFKTAVIQIKRLNHPLDLAFSPRPARPETC